MALLRIRNLFHFFRLRLGLSATTKHKTQKTSKGFGRHT
ncbi:hypothetical protein LINPERPRIM_LOCUS20099 [Linum perenne]